MDPRKKYVDTKIFDGNVDDFPAFERDVDSQTSAQSIDAYLFLHPPTPYTLDQQGLPTDLPLLYTRISKLPDIWEKGLSAADKKTRKQDYETAVNHNVMQENIIKIIKTTILERLAPNMLQSFALVHTAPQLYRYWTSLPKLYGPATAGHIRAGDNLLNLIARVMVQQSSFASTMAQMDIDYAEAELPEKLISAILFSDGTNDLKLQFLPARFNAALAYMRISNAKYADARTYFHQQDQLLTRAITAQQSTAVVNAVAVPQAQPAQHRHQQKKKGKKPTTNLEGDEGQVTIPPPDASTQHVHITVECVCGRHFNPSRRNDTFCPDCATAYKDYQKNARESYIRNARAVHRRSQVEDMSYEDLEEAEQNGFSRHPY
jgi:hypothetical protein